ncbi:MAG: Arylsulfatase, partial [Planctomycetota bacterium]
MQPPCGSIVSVSTNVNPTKMKANPLQFQKAATAPSAHDTVTSPRAAERQHFHYWLESFTSVSAIATWVVFVCLLGANPRRTQAAQDDAPAAGQPGRPQALSDRATSPERRNLLASEPHASASESGPPPGWTIHGDAAWGSLGDPEAEYSGRGLRFLSGKDLNRDGKQDGFAALMVRDAASKEQRWFRVRIRALAQDDFRVAMDDLYLRIDFFRDGGTNPLDHVKQSLYELVERDRKILTDTGTNKKLGGATWRWFDMTFRTPFPEVDAMRLSVGFGHGQGKEMRGEFWVSAAELSAIEAPADYMSPKPPPPGRSKTEKEQLVPLGGRWYFDPRGGERTPPAEFSYRHAEQLLYLSDRFERPFADNMSAWLRQGYLDASGDVVKHDRFLAENVVVSFTSTHLVIRSHNLPNH